MSEEHPRPARSGFGIGIVVVLLLLVLSQLSVGPVAWMLDRGMISSETAEVLESTLYVPLVWLCDYSEICRSAVDRYIRFWQSARTAPPAPPPPVPPAPAASPAAGPPSQAGN